MQPVWTFRHPESPLPAPAPKTAQEYTIQWLRTIERIRWYPQEIFLDSYRWPGRWTSKLEDWYKAHLQKIKNFEVEPRGASWWKEHWAKSPPHRRKSGEDVPVNTAAARVLLEIRDSAIFDRTILHKTGIIEWNRDYAYE